ncbi:hypothetical protein [Brevundimonas lutea]|uniref:hypothetical protein n=1 Tax=Brevundimonas lutea TaxID=2293980 RepID=UPI000F031784|nr:hypothetical protein [Brevundimonas lutea]
MGALLAVASISVNCYSSRMTSSLATLNMSPSSPTALEARLAIARAHAGWAQAVAAGERTDAARWVVQVAGLSASDTAASSQLLAMRLWAIEAKLRSGDPAGAEQDLHRHERDHGATHQSRLLKAQLNYFRGDFEAAAQACADAIILLPPAKTPGKAYSQIVRFHAECLCLAERHDEARVLLHHAFAHKSVWTTEDIKALRRTVTDERSLAEFHAFLASYFAFPGIRSRAALYHFSMACRDLGLYERAELAIRQRFLSASAMEAFGARPASLGPKPQWVQDARQTLTDLKASMAAAEAEMFLISGTLLGAVREGDILGHDKDIDVGVMDAPGLDKRRVEEALGSSGRFSVKPYQNPALLRVQHASGVMVDVFWHREEGGLIVHEGMKSKWWNTPFSLADFQFLGDTHRIPANFGRYLGENYGDWERPDTEFETFVDTPNMVVTSEGEIVWYFYCKLFDYYLQGRVAQFGKVAAALKRLRPGDHAVQVIADRALSGLRHGAESDDDNLPPIGFEALGEGLGAIEDDGGDAALVQPMEAIRAQQEQSEVDT